MEGEEGRRGRERARDGGRREGGLEGRREGMREGGKEGRREGGWEPGQSRVTSSISYLYPLVKPTLAYASAGCDLYTTT